MMAAERRMRLAAPDQKSKTAVPIEERGKMMFVPDVLELLGGKKSLWWVRNRFAPEHKHYLGRDPYWWSSDVQKWLDEQGAAA